MDAPPIRCRKDVLNGWIWSGDYQDFSSGVRLSHANAQANCSYKRKIMNSSSLIPPPPTAAAQHVEFFRLPGPGKRDPHFGLSRSWYYKAATTGEIKMVALRHRGALRGVRLVVYDSVADFVRRAAQAELKTNGRIDA